MDRKNKYVVAVDLGGTNIRVALVSNDNQILTVIKRSSEASKGQKYVMRSLEKSIEYILHKSNKDIEDIKCISIAVAGINDIKNGIVTDAPNLPGWRNVNLQQIISRRFNLPVYLINDATAAAIGEHRLGAGIGSENLIYLTVSTGIGGGIIIGNKPYYGTDGAAGELGHMKIVVSGPECNCGKPGCLEALASGSAITKRAIEAINEGKPTVLKSFYEQNINSLTAEKVTDAAKQGDVLAGEIVKEAAYYLGIGLSNLINIFNPDIIVIGGGLSNAGEIFLSLAKRIAKKVAFKLPASTVKIVKSKLGDNAGIIGAALAAFDQFEN